jgi:uncharacterized protein (DUF433 family)/DNA-binding transcriptional MerR regulator
LSALADETAADRPNIDDLARGRCGFNSAAKSAMVSPLAKGAVLMSIHVDTRKIDWKEVGHIGLYTVPMAARILHEDGIRLRAWINGAQHSDAQPIIQRQLPRINGQTVFGFLDLIEARFIKHFRDLGLSPQAIRRFANKLRERHHTDHPFAMNKAFRTDGKVIFMEIAEDENDKRILNLLNDNFEMGDVIEKSLFASILYADDLAYRWRPSDAQPSVVLDPSFAFGRPTIEGIWIPTDILAAAAQAEGDISAVAEDFEIDEAAVAQAVAYEQSLSAGARVEDKAG